MDERDIESSLANCESELAAGRAPNVETHGFWRSVAAVKRRPDLVARYADRIARIDRAVFVHRVKLRFPAMLGVALLAAGSLVGLVILSIAKGFDHPLRELAVLVGIVATSSSAPHPLAPRPRSTTPATCARPRDRARGCTHQAPSSRNSAVRRSLCTRWRSGATSGRSWCCSCSASCRSSPTSRGP